MIGVKVYPKTEDEAKEPLCVYGITPFGPTIDGKSFMFDVNPAQGDYLLDKIRL
jgi:hypothetical protein